MSNKLKYIAENLDSLKIGLDETFKFNCTMCGKCCIDREDILLKPKDLFIAFKELSMKPHDFIQKYCECYVGDSSRLPIVRLKPVGQNKLVQCFEVVVVLYIMRNLRFALCSQLVAV